MTMARQPLIVGIGGTPRAGSSTEMALRTCMGFAESLGAHTESFTGDALVLPMYGVGAERSPEADRLVAALRACDGVIIASPAYHGTVSGLLKNALDYVEDLARDDTPYLDGRAIGCIACAYGWQAAGTTLVALRSIAHALRGWPTPMGAGINATETKFDGDATSPVVLNQLRIVAEQVVSFAGWRLAARPLQ
jgi:FMN reductase